MATIYKCDWCGKVTTEAWGWIERLYPNLGPFDLCNECAGTVKDLMYAIRQKAEEQRRVEASKPRGV